jgi:hypothetical protein
VDAFPQNPWGIYQVHGNVWEWVEDCWNSTYAGAPVDGAAWLAGECGTRVVRGGSWDNYPDNLRSGLRTPYKVELRTHIIGLRVARTLTLSPRSVVVETELHSSAIDVVRAFYLALGSGDGARATSMVIAEKRTDGPFNAGELTTFYGSMAEPLKLLSVTETSKNNYLVKYSYRAGNRPTCEGSATVVVVLRDGRPQIERISALNGC